MPSIGEVAYTAAARVTGCTQPWSSANQQKWSAAAHAVLQSLSGDCEIRAALRDRMRREKITQGQLAGIIGISLTYMSDAMTGKRPITPKMAAAAGFSRVQGWAKTTGGDASGGDQ